MDRHTIHRFWRFAWAERNPLSNSDFMWSSTRTYHRLIGKLWWTRPTEGGV